MKRMLDYTRGDNVTDLVPATPGQSGQLDSPLPTRSPDSELYLFSKVNFSRFRGFSKIYLIVFYFHFVLILSFSNHQFFLTIYCCKRNGWITPVSTVVSIQIKFHLHCQLRSFSYSEKRINAIYTE